jgi:hypothetical protein
MTTWPFSKWRMALRRMYGSATSRISMAVCTLLVMPRFSSAAWQEQQQQQPAAATAAQQRMSSEFVSGRVQKREVMPKHMPRYALSATRSWKLRVHGTERM